MTALSRGDEVGVPALPEAQVPAAGMNGAGRRGDDAGGGGDGGQGGRGKGSRRPSFYEVLANGPFRKLWTAQIFSQLAQNMTWVSLGAFVAQQNQSGKNTLVSIIIVSAMLAQFLLSGFAGVIVDRTSKRAMLFGSNVARVALTLLFIAMTPLPVGIQTTGIIVLIFIANSVAQFFAPAEAATIPLLVEKRNLIAASSVFNLTFNACQVIPTILGLLLLEFIHIVPVLLLIALFYVAAAVLVATLPARTTAATPAPVAGSLREAGRHLVADVREGLHFLARDPGLRRTIFLINVPPTFVFVFGALGYTFVQQTFGLPTSRAWILLLPAGVGLVVGALTVGRIAARRRKEDLINVGLLSMGVAVAVLGAVATIVNIFGRAANTVSNAIASRTHHATHAATLIRNEGLIGPAMVIAVVIGLAMSLSSIPAQTLIFERTSEEVRGRVLAMSQLIGGAIPIIPLLVVGPLADIFGTSSIMTVVGIVVVLIGAFSVHLDRMVRR